MNILMVTNTFTPHVGGVANSVARFTKELRRTGHRVLVVAPEYEGGGRQEEDVVRVPALQRFNGSDFAVPVPLTLKVSAALRDFQPQVVHSHHPYLLGDMALRAGAARGVPVVFTYHTMYEEYTHYVPVDFPQMKRFVIDLATGYCNLCDTVVAPSESMANILVGRGVTAPVVVIPTGVDLGVFEGADGSVFRDEAGIPEGAFLVGHVGRLAPEKNMSFLADAVAGFLEVRPDSRFLLVGEGTSRAEILACFDRRGLSDRIHCSGVLQGRGLASAYRAMDVFAFASLTETQGMVLTEAMAAGVPVVALDGPGAREVVRDGENGRLVRRPDEDSFRDALRWVEERTPGERRRLSEGAAATAREYSIARSAEKLVSVYRGLVAARYVSREIDASPWTSARKRIGKELEILRNIARAAGEAVLSEPDGKDT